MLQLIPCLHRLWRFFRDAYALSRALGRDGCAVGPTGCGARGHLQDGLELRGVPRCAAVMTIAIGLCPCSTARCSLVRRAWGAFKQRLALSAPDLMD